MSKHHHMLEDAPVLSTLTPDAFWRLPLADRDWLAYACGISAATAARLLDVLGADTVRIGARTFIFPQRIAAAVDALATRVSSRQLTLPPPPNPV